MNRLARERSPYLLQHAQNPVDWYPWGDEAFARARLEDKPIFLSIGYSTCHWCHVMEHESFENDAIAAVLNREFIPIKVDREERPDVDRVYMTFVQGTTGSGGWPMSVWLTPELKPFYGGTYFPPSAKWGRPGFHRHPAGNLPRVAGSERGKVVESAEALTAQLKQAMEQASPSADRCRARTRSTRRSTQFREAFDPRHGGFGDAPKFPRPSELLFLLREHARTGDGEPLEMTLRTLRAMALGGMRDHVGGGFHRYSVDAAWRVPHFEKMLYDQAQLVLAFVEAAQASGDPFYSEVAEDTLQYVMREMTDDAGGFYSAEDADSIPPEHAGIPGTPHKTEGAFYLWTAAEIDAMLGDDAAMFKLLFGVRPGGNAAVDPQEEFTGKNLLYVAHSVEEIAARTGPVQTPRSSTILQRARLKMFEARLGASAPASRRQSADGVERADDRRLRARVARVLRGLGADGRTAGEPYLESARKAAALHSRSDVERGHADAAAPLSRGPRRDRRLRRRLRVSDLRPARTVPGRSAADVARMGHRAAASAGRAVLGRAGGRLVQHHRQRSERPAAHEGGIRRRRTDGELGIPVMNLLVLLALPCGRRGLAWNDRIDRTLRLFGEPVAKVADGPRRCR